MHIVKQNKNMKLVKSEIITNIKNKLMEESEAVSQASRYIDDAFYEAVRAILECKGKVVITGVGKSGHVGRKLLQAFPVLAPIILYACG